MIVVVFLRDGFFAQSSTLNNKPQLGPQHRHHHDEVRKNGISYAVGLMRSIAYRRIRLVNRKTAIIARMTPHVGISCELIKPCVRRLGLFCDLKGCVTLWLRVLRYSTLLTSYFFRKNSPYLRLSPYRGKFMDPYRSTTARHRFFLLVLGPISYVAFVSVLPYVRCTRHIILKKIFFCSRRGLQYLIKIHEKRNSRNLARSFLSYPCTINN